MDFLSTANDLFEPDSKQRSSHEEMAGFRKPSRARRTYNGVIITLHYVQILFAILELAGAVYLIVLGPKSSKSLLARVSMLIAVIFH